MSRAARLLGGLLLLALALLVAKPLAAFDADLYDEGLIANGAALALRGQWPGASFYAPYPPGAFGALALAFQLWGVRLLVERWFAAALAALASALGFWLVTGFAAGTRRALHREFGLAWLAGLAAALLLGGRWVTPVNGGALALALASGLGLRAALPRGRPMGAFLCGGLIGAAALWRLDFGLYALAASLPVWLLFAGHGAGVSLTRNQRFVGVLAIGLGTLAMSGPPLGWILAHGGHRAADCLFWWPLTSTHSARLPWTRHWSAFLMPLASLLLFARAAPILRRDPNRAAAAFWLLFVGLGFLLYSLGRTHSTHLLPLRVISLLLAGLCVGVSVCDASRLPAAGDRTGAGRREPSPLSDWRLAGPVFLAMVVSAAVGPVHEYFHARQFPSTRRLSLPGPRGTGVFPPSREADDYWRIVAYLDHQVPGGARMYCGTPRHDLFLKDDNLAYFLSGRESGTYYWCLDCDVTSTRAVQAEMASELERSHVEVVLIRTTSSNHEPNASSRSSGVHLLDEYLRRHFRLAAVWRDYQFYRRCPETAYPSRQ
jgi:hypothetical protein